MDNFQAYVEDQSRNAPNRTVRSICFKLLESWKRMELAKVAAQVPVPPPEIVWKGMKAGDRAEYTEAGAPS